MSTKAETHEKHKYTDHYTDHMSSKTIMIKEETYDRLKSKKREDESFSDVIDRLTSDKPVNRIIHFGAWSHYPKEDIDKIKAAIRESSMLSTETLLKKLKRNDVLS
jgi:predicted CopG family antitoxin